MACDMPEPWKFPSLDSCQKRFLWTHMDVDLALHPVAGLCSKQVIQRSFFMGLVSKAWILFSVSSHGPCFTAVEEDESDKRLVELELAKLMVLHRQILFSLAIAEAILMRTSAEQILSLHRVVPRYLKLVTFSNFWPFMLIFGLMFVMISLFSVLTPIP